MQSAPERSRLRRPLSTYSTSRIIRPRSGIHSRATIPRGLRPVTKCAAAYYWKTSSRYHCDTGGKTLRKLTHGISHHELFFVPHRLDGKEFQ